MRHLSPEQAARLRSVLHADLQAGTFGMSTGLEYVPGIYSEPTEIIPLAREVGAAGGVIMSHMRSEDDEKINQSIDELVAQGAHARVHISHLKVVFGKGAERGRQLLAVIESKRKAGVDLTADAYPYTAGYTGIAILFPEWALPPADYRTSSRLARRARDVSREAHDEAGRTGGDAVRHPALRGADPGAGRGGCRQELRRFPDRARAERRGGRALHDGRSDAGRAVRRSVDRHLHRRSPGMRHPRSTGTYAKLFEALRSREEDVDGRAGHPQGVRPAGAVMRFQDRGTIKVGAKADLVLFDVSKVHATSSYVDPFTLAEGFDVVIVNGQVAREDEKLQPGRYGRVLRAGRR